ncbi:MAG: amidohydrolase family protein [Candidatus Thermoplasmatota archaeon]|jgi:cytosine/adenosine deaminase-related metal-dependent hydrolase|nr:amidohydrolase family protein [Candidatus Thermoplasmatota archaeon]
MDYVSGEILTNKGFEKGYVGFEKNKIVETGKGSPPKKPVCTGLITPSFVNAHTHIGDSFIKKKDIDLPRKVEELVAPPHGLKHRLLKEATEEEIIAGMRDSIETMKAGGVSCFWDFRETGITGVSQLRKSLKNTGVSSLILSRPKHLNYDPEEVSFLLENSDGIGLSSISDWDYSELEKVARHTKKENKIFALHASERKREDIDLILGLKPDFLVHMVFATESDLERVKDDNVPVVVCPRSNMFYCLKPNLGLLKKQGVDLLIGTDNAMISSPSVLDEIRYIKTISNEFSTEELLTMATYGARKVLNVDDSIPAPDSTTGIVVLDKESFKPLYIMI